MPDAPTTPAPEPGGLPPGAVMHPSTHGSAGHVRPEHVAAAAAAIGTALARTLPVALAGALAPPSPAVAPAVAPGRLLALYARYLALFVGAGLMAGAVVHFPLAPLRYALMGLAGAGLFAAGSAGEPTSDRTAAARALRLGASLALALGVGMVAGGIQHFGDVPRQAAVLIPAGLVIGLVAFAAREGHRPARRLVLPLAAAVAAVALALGLALGALTPAPAAGGGAAHGAGAHAPH